jgi:exopolysaccharide production protein ExoQ
MQAVSRARPAFEHGLEICVFLFLPVLVLASKGAAPLIGVAGVCALGVVAPEGTAAWRRVQSWGLLFAALVLFGVLSSLWAVNPWRSLLLALRLTGVFAAGLSLVAASSQITAPHRLIGCFVAGLVTALGLAVVQYQTNGVMTMSRPGREFVVTGLNQAENGFALLLLPLSAMLILRQRCVLAAFLAAVVFAAICQLVGEAGRIAFVIGLVAAVLLYRWRKWPVRAAAIVSVVLILTAPVVFPPLGAISGIHSATQHFKSSLWHRLEIWSFVGSRIVEKPLLGWGLDSSRAIPGGDTPIPGGYPGQLSLPLHPHNAPLQLWLELGVPGALFFAFLVARLWLALDRVSWPPLYAAAAGGSLVTALILGLGSYGIWQEWLVFSEFLTLFLILVMARVANKCVGASAPTTAPAHSPTRPPN